MTTRAVPAPRKLRFPWGWLLVAGLAAGGAGIVFVPRLLGRTRPDAVPAALTAQVTTVTAVQSVSTSGAVAAEQMASVTWPASGRVGEVTVRLGDFVQPGDVLMTLDRASASASLIQAESELLDAQAALDDLQHPTQTQLAQARQAVTTAEAALEAAQDDLADLQHPDLTYYADRVTQAQANLATAQQNVEVASIGNLANALENARADRDTKANWLSDAQSAQAACPGCTTVFVNAAGRRLSLADAEQAYAGALDAYRIAEVNFQQSQTKQADALASAQDALADAEANLAWAQRGADPADLAARENTVALAEADLADAQAALAELEDGPDPGTLRRAELRVEAAQASLDVLTLRAPIAGEVLQINYRPGDTISQSQVAILLANRTRLHVDAAVSEADISQVAPGDPVELAFDAVPGLVLTGSVATIDPVGAVDQGLVKYTVRVDLPASDPRVLLGMTANLSIVTDVRAGALAVPVEAVQLDDQGEYVMRQVAGGQAERVTIVSGDVIEAATAGTPADVVTVSGDLQPGDTVVLIPATAASDGAGFFGGGPRGIP